ncbi:DinB family protein [Flavobacterium sp.]|uniref:DinB family protein n=1 Tax=Flavobacterium sp. TaxID=239 RepID=UPI002B4B3A86|nr:DinB family protein [Flavobacterium sp.]HLP64893.1 DinB family protein [Flavobacterium sp.]
MNEIVETWEIHNRINLYLLNSIEEAHLSSVSLSKGRTVAEHFAHIHNVRLMWLKSGMPELLDSVEKIDKENITKDLLINQLNQSGVAITKMIEKAVNEGKLKGFKPHPTAFLGYIISHESHHRGQIVLCLKQSGHPIDKKIAFGLWEWGTR